MSEDHIEEDSYFVSMTDLMVGILFIFIILLMWFALNFQIATANLTDAQKTQEGLLKDIEQALKERGVEVQVFPESGILRLPEQLLFERGKHEVDEQGVAALLHLRDVLEAILPCYATVPNNPPLNSCNPDYSGNLESVLIEGHTDNTGTPAINWPLSTKRALAVYNHLVSSKVLETIHNTKEVPQALLAISGYGEKRPANTLQTELAHKENRRIDLRFIMAVPKAPAPQKEVEQKL